jgi:hemolysin activation/secretion protein
MPGQTAGVHGTHSTSLPRSSQHSAQIVRPPRSMKIAWSQPLGQWKWSTPLNFTAYSSSLPRRMSAIGAG